MLLHVRVGLWIATVGLASPVRAQTPAGAPLPSGWPSDASLRLAPGPLESSVRAAERAGHFDVLSLNCDAFPCIVSAAFAPGTFRGSETVWAVLPEYAVGFDVSPLVTASHPVTKQQYVFFALVEAGRPSQGLLDGTVGRALADFSDAMSRPVVPPPAPGEETP